MTTANFLLDRAQGKYSCRSFRHSLQHVEKSWGCRWPKSCGKCPLYSLCYRATTYSYLDLRQVSNMNCKRIRCLTFTSSAPGESPSTLRHQHRSDTIISEVHRNVINTQTMVRDVLRSQQEAGGQDWLVSDTCALFDIEQTLTAA